MKTDELKKRIERLEHRIGDDLVFTLDDGTTGAIRRRRILDAVIGATRGEDSPRTHILHHAVSASDGHMHELVRAFDAGPRPRGSLNEQQD